MRPRAALIFNLKTAPNRAWRFSPMYEQNRRLSDINSFSYNAIAVNDSAVIYRNEYQEEYRVAARLGTEWFKQYKKNTMVYGVDVIFGFNSEYFSFTDHYRSIDDEGYVDNFTIGPGYFDNEDFYNEEVFRLLVGIDFSVGYKVFLGEKADLTVEWIPEITYRPHIKTVTSGELLRETPVPKDDIVADMRGLSLQLHYKFLK